MIRTLLAGLAFGSIPVLGLAASAPEMPARAAPAREAPAPTFRAPDLPASLAIALTAPQAKSAVAEEEPGGRLRIANVRPLAKAAPVGDWQALAGGYVSRVEASSAGAAGLRVRLGTSGVRVPVEVRVQGADGRIEAMTIAPGAPEAWTPWTEGATQVIELFSRAPQPVRVEGIGHFDMAPWAKAAGSCTISSQCSTGDAALDAAIAQRKKSVMRIQFMEGGGGFLCTATLINTARFPQPYVLTANHCISNNAAAATVNSWWFYETTSCGSTSEAPGKVVRANGMDLVFGNHNVDSSLLIMRDEPPTGAVYSAWNAARVPIGASIASVSHPKGDTARIARGSVARSIRVIGRPQDMYGIQFSSGIIEGGSSGSGLFTLASGSLELRGVLSGTTIRNGGGMTCDNRTEDALYGRLELFYPQIQRFLALSLAQDDAPNRVIDFPPLDLAGADAPLETRGNMLAIDGKRLETGGDVDLFRFVLQSPAAVTAWTEGPGNANVDTVGNILDADGVSLEANDDAETRSNHFGVTWYLQPGIYYVQVGHFEPNGTGTYNLRVRADPAPETNRTALWWNAAESGWGLNVNHQGNKVFATLFTYNAQGHPMWLVMSNGTLQPDGTYQGELYRMTGPAFNAVPFGAATPTAVGSMRLAFTGTNQANMAYTVDGVSVSKSMTRQDFAGVASCRWSGFDRSFEFNYQDLWYNPAEPGWGVNITHQGDTVFATLFTYDANGQNVWLVMSNGALSGGSYSGPLYRMSGPAFNAGTWTTAVPTQVGTMTFAPEDGNSARLTYTYDGVTVSKQVRRQVFGSVRPACE